MKRKHKFNKVLSAITAISCLYSSLDIVTASEANSDFDPYVFYEEILNEKRPTGAEGYRFLDLDGDGKEELLIGGERSGKLSAYVIMALYTCSAENNSPISIFAQQPEAGGHYSVKANGVICYSLSPNMHGQYIGHLNYRLFNGEQIPICAYVNNTQSGNNHAFYKSEDVNLISSFLPNDYYYDFSKWEKISGETFNELYFGNIENDDSNFIPWMESFYTYDAQKELEKTNKEKTIPVAGRYGYDELIQYYKEILSTKGYNDDIFSSYSTYYLPIGTCSVLFQEYIFRNQLSWCFILHDFNRDKSYELAIGCLENNGDFTVFDLYTINDNKIIHLAAAASRLRYNMNEDEIIEKSSNGAFNGSKIKYGVDKGALTIKSILQTENAKHYTYDDFGTASEIKKEIDQHTYDEILKYQYSSKLNQDVIMLKDWYPGMRINENPDGDANDDGEINILDVLLVHKHILSTSGETVVDTSYADINMDNMVNVIDLMLLKRKLVNP